MGNCTSNNKIKSNSIKKQDVSDNTNDIKKQNVIDNTDDIKKQDDNEKNEPYQFSVSSSSNKCELEQIIPNNISLNITCEINKLEQLLKKINEINKKEINKNDIKKISLLYILLIKNYYINIFEPIVELSNLNDFIKRNINKMEIIYNKLDENQSINYDYSNDDTTSRFYLDKDIHSVISDITLIVTKYVGICTKNMMKVLDNSEYDLNDNLIKVLSDDLEFSLKVYIDHDDTFEGIDESLRNPKKIVTVFEKGYPINKMYTETKKINDTIAKLKLF
jgi:hypothetical protein